MKAKTPRKVETRYYYTLPSSKANDSIDIIVDEEFPDKIKIESHQGIWKSWDNMIAAHEDIIAALKELRKEYNK